LRSVLCCAGVISGWVMSCDGEQQYLLSDVGGMHAVVVRMADVSCLVGGLVGWLVGVLLLC
jgi:hypothetical protein